MVMLGGSITVGHGPRDGQNSWVSRIETWINTTFPHPNHVFLNKAVPAVSCPPPTSKMFSPRSSPILAGDYTCRHTDRSLLAQVTSAYISPCVQNLVPEDTDLVIVEFTFNDSERTKSREFEDPTRCAA